MRQLRVGLVIPIVFFLVLFVTLSHYGMNEDSPGHFTRGQTYLQKFLSGVDYYVQPKLPTPLLFIPGQRISTYKPNAYETGASSIRPIASYEGSPTIQEIYSKYRVKFGRKSMYEHNFWGMNYWLQNDGGHPPISDILTAATNRLFYEQLGIVGDVQGYYMYMLIVASIMIFFFYLFVEDIWGKFTAVIASLVLTMYPLFFAESHFNVKDIAETSFFCLSIIFFYYLVNKKEKKWFYAFTGVFFLALGTKLNIVFLPVILFLWLIFTRQLSRKITFAFFISSIIVGILMFMFWPFLWENTAQKIVAILNFYDSTSITDLRIQTPSPYLMSYGTDLRGLLYVLGMTPTLSLIFLFVGLATIISNGIVTVLHKVKKDSGDKTRGVGLLIVIWFVIPILRVLRPNADVFESVRQYLEFLPALAIIAALGAVYIFNKINSYFERHPVRFWSKKIYCSLIFIVLLIPIVRYHPNENVFFNSFFGGAQGALDKKLLGWQTNYGNPYYQGVAWLNAHAPEHAKLAYLDGTMISISPQWLRHDILFGSHFSGFNRRGEYIISLVYPQPPQVFAYLYLERFLKPVYEIKADGVAIAKVWKNDNAHLKDAYKKIQTVEKTYVITTGTNEFGKYWQVNFKKSERVVKLEIGIKSDDCNPRDGLFTLNTFFVPKRIDTNSKVVEFDFPGENTKRLRFYGLIANSCILQGEIKNIYAVK